MNRLALSFCLLAATACSDDSPSPSGSPTDTDHDAATDAAVDGDVRADDARMDGAEPDTTEADTTDPDDAAMDVADSEVDVADADPADTPVDAEPDTPREGCTGPDSCDPGHVCTGELGCGMAWTCVERTCDADDPAVLLCSCDGRTFRAQLSCVGRPAAYVIEQVSPVPEDVMCNPEVEGPVYFDVVVTGVGFEAYEGKEVHLRVQDTSRGEVAALGVVTVEGGGFSVRFDDVFDPDLFGVILEYYVDVDGNGSCDPESDRSFSAFVNNSFDWEGQEAPVTISPENEDPEICTIW